MTDTELLKSLGLSEDAARVYTILVENPTDLSFEETSVKCKLPMKRAHRALEELVSKGFVKVEGNKFAAMQPKQALVGMLEKKEKELHGHLENARNVIASLQKSLEPIYLKTRAGIKAEEILEPLESLSAMELRTAQIIANAEREILIFAQRFDWYDKISEVLAQALDRGVKVRVLMLVADKTALLRAKELKQLGVQVRRCIEKSYPVRGTLVDGKELVFLIWATRKDIKKPLHFRPHYTTNDGLIKVFLDAYEKRWQEAKPLGK